MKYVYQYTYTDLAGIRRKRESYTMQPSLPLSKIRQSIYIIFHYEGRLVPKYLPKPEQKLLRIFIDNKEVWNHKQKGKT